MAPKGVKGDEKDSEDDSKKGIRRGRAAGRRQQEGDLPGPVRDARRNPLLSHLRGQDGRRGLAVHREVAGRPGHWTPPPARKIAEAKRARDASYNTVKTFAERYLRERGLRPTTVHNYQGLLATRINPYFAAMPLKNVTLSEIKAWRASLNPKTEATNAAAYRLLRSLLQAAEEEELIDRAPPKIRGAGSAPVRHVAVPATMDEIAVITDTMPERLRLLIVLAAFVGLRQGELLELRRSDARRGHRPDQGQPQGRQGRGRRCERSLPTLRSRRQRAEDRERCADRSRAAAIPADAAEAPTRAGGAWPDQDCSSPVIAPTT